MKIPQFIVSDISFATNKLLQKIYTISPYKTVAITGTNGKNICSLVYFKKFTLLKYSNTSVGTLGHFYKWKKMSDINLTTPAYEELYKYGSISERKYIYIFEASSHALQQNRLRNYPINIAAITNISRDHLDFHKTFSNYKKPK